MDNLERLYQHSHIYIEPAVVTPDFCAALIADGCDHQQRAALRLPDGTLVVDEHERKTSELYPPPHYLTHLEQAVLARQPAICQRLGLEASAVSASLVLGYGAGDFFMAHRDTSPHYTRRITAVIFLNTGYSGGELVLYGVLDDPRLVQYGVPIAGQTGLLVAFPADTVHEVKPVTAGERYTAVVWLK